ncbi:MAG: hypothetical protein RBR49_12560 [Desulfovibrio desulfuricans]|nr:hypothetical protein [Desulfovibrio desulfuricans]
MRIQTVGAGPHPDFSKVGCVVTIAGVSIDCAERQTDSAEIIDLRDVDGSGRVVEGGSGYQVASIHIPPRVYGDAACDGEDGAEHRPVDLDPGTVLVTLWTYNQ